MIDTQLETIEIESLAFGGAGLGHLPSGKAVFVDGTAPGDTVRVRVEIERRSHAVAVVEQIVQNSQARVEPPCPSALECGACPWQHLGIETQRQWKVKLLSDELERSGLGTGALEPMRVGIPLGQRVRTRMRLEDRSFGTTARRSHRVVPLVACPILTPELEKFSLKAARVLGSTHGGQAEVELYVDAHGNRGMHVEPGRSGKGPAWRDVAARLDVKCLRIGTGQASAPGGDPSLLDEVSAGRPLAFEPGIFIQTSRSMNDTLVRESMALAGTGGRFAEVYSGAGNFTVHLALAFESGSASEQDGSAARLLRTNVEAVGAGARVKIVRERDARSAQRLAGEPAVEVLLADPPRAGMAELAPVFKSAPPARVVMISCHPMAAVRDICLLVRQAGYRLERIVPVDMFPHSDHLELVALMCRS